MMNDAKTVPMGGFDFRPSPELEVALKLRRIAAAYAMKLQREAESAPHGPRRGALIALCRSALETLDRMGDETLIFFAEEAYAAAENLSSAATSDVQRALEDAAASWRIEVHIHRECLAVLAESLVNVRYDQVAKA